MTAAHGAVVGGFICVVFLLGDELLFVELLAALPIELRLGQIRLALGQRGHRRIVIGRRGFHPGLRRLNARHLGLDVGARLDILQVEQDVALLDVVTFLDHDIRDFPYALAQDVRIVLGANFTRGGHNGRQILPHYTARLHGDNALILLVDAVPGHASNDEGGAYSDRDFLPRLHCTNLGFNDYGTDTIPATDSTLETGQNVSWLRRSKSGAGLARLPFRSTLAASRHRPEAIKRRRIKEHSILVRFPPAGKGNSSRHACPLSPARATPWAIYDSKRVR